MTAPTEQERLADIRAKAAEKLADLLDTDGEPVLYALAWVGTIFGAKDMHTRALIARAVDSECTFPQIGGALGTPDERSVKQISDRYYDDVAAGRVKGKSQ